MDGRIRILCCLIAGVLLLVMPTAAQIEVGDNVTLGLSGEVSAGYAGNFGNGSSSGSAHALDFGGSGNLHGFYYNPQFLSFQAQPYYNRTQANSAFQSIEDSSGITGSFNIFGGSHFPGSISFLKERNSLGQFGVPGVTGLSTRASGSTLEFNWAALFPDRPTLNVSYLLGGQDATVYGSDSRTNQNTRTLNIRSDYLFRGFQLDGFYIHQSLDSSFPSVLAPSGASLNSSKQQGGNSSVGFMASHRIPVRGFWSANVTHSNYDSNTQGSGFTSSSNGSSNSINTTASIQPLHNLGMSVGANYQTNLLGALQAQIVQAGGNPALLSTDSSSRGITVRADTYYQPTSYLTLNGQCTHIQQYFGGKSTGITQFGGGIFTHVAHRFLGSFTFNVGAVDTATQEGNSGAGLYANLAFSRKFSGWETGADLNYAQQVQTLGLVYTTSVYGYGGSVRKKFGDRLYWTNAARDTRSGLAQHEGTSSHSDSFSTTLVYRGVSANAVYSQSAGAAILTSQGLIPVPLGVPNPLVEMPVVYRAKSYGGGLSATVRRFSLTGSYAKAWSQTTTSTFSNNGTTMWNALFRARMRKLYFDAGFTRFDQRVGTVGAPNSVINSYFVGVSRWFNVF